MTVDDGIEDVVQDDTVFVDRNKSGYWVAFFKRLVESPSNCVRFKPEDLTRAAYNVRGLARYRGMKVHIRIERNTGYLYVKLAELRKVADDGTDG